MVATPTTLPDLDGLDAGALKALILSQHEQLLSRDHEIEHLKLFIAKLRRMQFGGKSEKLDRQIEQLELKLEDLESHCTEPASPTTSTPWSAESPSPRPARRPLPAHLPRQTQTHQPQQRSCPQCGGELRRLGEDICEVLEYVPASFVVVRHVRPKLSCTCCDCIVQAPAASRPIERGLAGPGLLAHVLTSKLSPRSTPAKAWNWIAPRWPTGWARAAACWNH